MKKISLALLLTVGYANAATITPPNPYEDKPTLCIEGAQTLVKYITAEPKKVFGEKAGEPIARLTNEERARVFLLTNLTMDKEGSQENICSILISANPQLPEADKNKVNEIYPPTRIQFKVVKTDGEPMVSPLSFTKIVPKPARK